VAGESFPGLEPGLSGRAELVVGEEHTAPRVGSGKVHVLVVTKIESRTVTFRVEAHDEKELIGDGTHERVVVNVAKFDARIRKKLGMER
jgi:fluoroacetyl-CoA thioesterase